MAYVIILAHLLGFVSSLDALMSTRTPQGSVAWIISLNTFPLLAVPAYWIFGRTKFQGYVTVRQELDARFAEHVDRLREQVTPHVHDYSVHTGGGVLAGSALADLPYLDGNRVDLLIDGVATFDSILAGIDAAQDYVLVQFYIVRDDGLGRRLAARLAQRAREGLRVWLLYDEIGSHELPDAYVAGLREAGVQVSAFHSTRGSGNRLQLNFRNHRKIVVADGHVGWVGGHNVGDEYVGHCTWAASWRDTHVRLEGPAVLELQLSFVEDWRWATDVMLDLPWEPRVPEGGNATVLVLPSGPADRLETASLMYQEAIHSARERVWIASPYFIPDEGVMAALHLARLRGVDVRVVIPDVADRKVVYFATFAFVGQLLKSGVKVLRYQPGFLHQKVFLVDDGFAGVGTANFDNRSFRLNFEITALVLDRDFVRDVERMLEADFARSRAMTLDELHEKRWWFRALARAAYLTAPVQ